MNAMGHVGVATSFAKSIFSLLERVEYRRITASDDFIDIERLRRNSYEAKTFVDSEKFGSFLDESDGSDDCYVIGVYIDEQLVSTVRLHIVTAEHLHGPSVKLFPDAAMKLLQNGETLIDPSRFASDPVAMWKYPSIPLLTLRAAAMAIEYFSADYCMSVVREDTKAFYKRCLGAVELSSSSFVDGYSVPLIIMTSRIADIREKVATRFPFFKSQPYERKMMFAPRDQLTYPSLNILPTAKYAHNFRDTIKDTLFPEVMPA
jgi:hypothetical protein